MKEIKITGTKWYVDIEYKENIARFGGEMCVDGFYATVNSISWIKHQEYIEKNDRKIVLTDRGREVLNEYMTIIRFMSAHLSLHCGTTENQAYEDALNATCAFSDVTRNGVANFIKSEMKGAQQALID